MDFLSIQATLAKEKGRRSASFSFGWGTGRFEARSVSLAKWMGFAFCEQGDGSLLTELTELEAPPIEFDEKLWHAVVDKVTVYNDDRLVYSLKDGTEITIEL